MEVELQQEEEEEEQLEGVILLHQLLQWVGRAFARPPSVFERHP